MRPMSTTPPTDETEASIRGEAPVTVMVSETFATFSAKSRVIVWPTLTMTPFWSTEVKPGSSTFRS